MATLSFFRPVLPTDALELFMASVDQIATETFTPEKAVLGMARKENNIACNERSTRAIAPHKMYRIGSLSLQLVQCSADESQRRALMRLSNKMHADKTNVDRMNADWQIASVMAGFANEIDATGNLDYPLAALDQRFSPRGSREVEVVLRPASGLPVQSQLLREQSIIHSSIGSIAPRFLNTITVNESGTIPFMRLPAAAVDSERQSFFEQFARVRLPQIILGELNMKFDSV